MIQQFEDLGSPIAAFLRDKCDVDAAAEVGQAKLFDAWKAWSIENGRERPGTVQVFGRNLRAALPWLREVQHRELGTPVRFYAGLRVKD